MKTRHVHNEECWNADRRGAHSARVRKVLIQFWLHFLLCMFAVIPPALSTGGPSDRTADLISFIGHGAAFDGDGIEIALTPAFLDKAQKFYIESLLKQANSSQRSGFEEKRKRLTGGRHWDPRSEYFINYTLIEWLIREIRPANANELETEVAFLKQKLSSVELQDGSLQEGGVSKQYELPEQLREMLVEEGLIESPTSTLRLSTLLGGGTYINQCRREGVPIPPDWGTSDWIDRGELFVKLIGEDSDARVYTYQSGSPKGVCIALPRSEGDTIEALGIICMGDTTGKACFWDNQRDKLSFDIQKGTMVPIREFAGGADLHRGEGGTCTACHAGENPYLIHPGTALGSPNLSELDLMPNDWYEPIVHPEWPQNPGPDTSLESVPSAKKCTSCHSKTGGAGRFPWVSTELRSYCVNVVRQAYQYTMPPFPGAQPNDPDYAVHVDALLKVACRRPPPAAFNGVWNSTFGRLGLHQFGEYVIGDYADRGIMLGKVKGECMAGVFTNGSKNGAFHFEQATDGQFEGVWAWQGSTQVGTWSGTRTSSSSPIDFKNFRRRPGDRHNQRIPNKRTDYDGNYGSTYGSLKLRHRDLFLIGDYGERGIFAAMWDGTSFVGKFTNGASTGWMDFAFFSPTAAFQSGEWGWDSGQPAAGSWNLNRQNNTTPDVDNMWKQMNCD